MMNVETIILDEFDQLLDDSQIHFVEKITHYAPRDHQLIYMSATTKFDQEKIAPNTRTMISLTKNWTTSSTSTCR